MVAAKTKKITKKINLLKQTASLCSTSLILGAPAPGRPNGFQTGAFSAKNNGIKK
jgi:hypothetical protein